ncbi:MAG: dihydropteroate synthase [Rhodospirillales bacterium]|nr:dihydropteroate synthase [Rhodospirillales bacterium]MDH3919419.1 dihydropteroate synthase [Rhodospirillales bacterium]MDH3968205.1 dihydropteroate synthase [Rhodospirillales bacterium]
MGADRRTKGEGLYLRPLGLVPRSGAVEGFVPLAGGPLGFAACEVILRAGPRTIGREILPVAALDETLRARDPALAEAAGVRLERLGRARSPLAGLPMDRPQVMGVVNVTPDSFSDGGDRFDPGRAVAGGLEMLAAGAALLDVGGESTRPGAEPVPRCEELRRVVPVVRGLADQGAVVSIDTRHARVMAEALDAGAAVINDVTALAGDPESLGLAARAGVPVVLMHMQGEPRSMQDGPAYDDAALDVFDSLAARVAACEAAGIDRARIVVDPGIGFGKTVRHNLEILEQLAIYHGLGCALLLGVSRKGFIARVSGDVPPKARLPGSLAAALAGLERGVQLLRVHDVAETVQAVAVWCAIASVRPEVARTALS